jgi:hypothetical protein
LTDDPLVLFGVDLERGAIGEYILHGVGHVELVQCCTLDPAILSRVDLLALVSDLGLGVVVKWLVHVPLHMDTGRILGG